MKLIFVHGRSQEDFEEDALKQTWIDTLNEGLAKSNLTLPPDVTIEFPYYGKLLKKLTDNPALIPTSKTAVRSGIQPSELTFSYQFLTELLKNAGENAPSDRGILNNDVIQSLFQKLDKKDKLGEFALKTFTKDVFYYLTNPDFKDAINSEILRKFDTEPCVVVGHSLGSIVSYVILRENKDLQVKKLITVGSPLGMASIQKYLPKPQIMPECVQHGWFNAFDDGDFVALNPLDSTHFPILTGTIENKNDVVNQTDNQHGIVGYLNDAVVAKQIYDALLLPN